MRRRLEAALRALWPEASVHLFGSAALGLAAGGSDVDVCVLLPSEPAAHCRDAAGRARLRPLLPRAAERLRACDEVSGVQLVLGGRTPLVRFEYDRVAMGGRSADGATMDGATMDGAAMEGAAMEGVGPGGERARAAASAVVGSRRQQCTSVELCINNTDGLANTAVLRELLASDAAGTARPLPALTSAVRRWAKRRLLAGLPSTLNAYSWTLCVAAHEPHTIARGSSLSPTASLSRSLSRSHWPLVAPGAQARHLRPAAARPISPDDSTDLPDLRRQARHLHPAAARRASRRHCVVGRVCRASRAASG